MRGTWQTTDSGGGGGLVLAVAAAALLIGSGAASAAVSALVTIAIVTGCVLTAAVLGGIALLVYRARSELRRSDRPGRPIAGPVVRQLPPAERPVLSADHKPAIGPGREVHYHFHVSAAELAAIMRLYTEEE
jgi:hypothetical protein